MSPKLLAIASQMEFWSCISANQEMGGRTALSSSSLPGCFRSLECSAAEVSTGLPAFQTHGPHWLGRRRRVSVREHLLAARLGLWDQLLCFASYAV